MLAKAMMVVVAANTLAEEAFGSFQASQVTSM